MRNFNNRQFGKAAARRLHARGAGKGSTADRRGRNALRFEFDAISHADGCGSASVAVTLHHGGAAGEINEIGRG